MLAIVAVDVAVVAFLVWTAAVDGVVVFVVGGVVLEEGFLIMMVRFCMVLKISPSSHIGLDSISHIKILECFSAASATEIWQDCP